MELPEDTVVSEILLRLPVQSLFRFRCVCKIWFSQINSPLFKEKHIAYRLAKDDDDRILVKRTHHCGRPCDFNDVVSFYDDYESLTRSKSSSYSLDMGSNVTTFSTHVNGIVCLISGNIKLFNPALKELITVPRDPFRFTSLVRRRAVGFGFDDATKDYIVVEIVSLRRDTEDIDACTNHKCVLYNVRTDSWTMIEEMPAFVSATYFNNDVICSSFFSHGSIHWFIGRESNDYRILTFNTTSKLFQEIQFPHGWNDDYRYLRSYLFKVDNSCIALAADYYIPEGRCVQGLDVWVMKEYGVRESWTKQYSINSFYFKKPLSFWRRDKLIFLTATGIVCYDLSKGEECGSIGMSNADVESIEVVTCYESFVSIKQSSKYKE